MSLQVWLPLNGNLNNQGLLSNPIISTTPTYVDGKLGKAMSTGALTLTAEQTNSVLNNKAVSFCFWIKVIGTDRQMIFGNDSMSANNNRKFAIFQYPTVNDLHLSWMNDTGNNTFIATILTGCFPNNIWTHCAITYENPICKVYINGEVKAEYNGASNSSTFAYSTPLIHNSSGRLLNDFRIYDHCLSAKEVKELAKGLVLHYKLTGPGQENLIRNSQLATSWGNGEVLACNEPTGYSFDGECIKITSGTSGNQNNGYGLLLRASDISYSVGEKLTFSVDIKGRGQHIGLWFLGTDGNWWTGANFHTYFTQYNDWTRISVTGTVPSGAPRIMLGLHAGLSNNTLYAKNMKLERGSISTPWRPNSTDSLYSFLGFNSIIEPDCSGFGNNGTKSRSIISNSNSPRYNSSYNFIPSNKITSTTGMPVGSNTVFTINFWLYIPSGKTFTQWGDFIGFNGNNIRLETSNTSASNLNWYNYPIGSANGLTNFSLTKDTWNMITLVCDGSKFIQYLNGSLLANTNLSGTAFSTNGSIWIGDTTNMYFNMSDLRIYATALSADDIKELYNSSVSIDKSGNLFAYEFMEV